MEKGLPRSKSTRRPEPLPKNDRTGLSDSLLALQQSAGMPSPALQLAESAPKSNIATDGVHIDSFREADPQLVSIVTTKEVPPWLQWRRRTREKKDQASSQPPLEHQDNRSYESSPLPIRQSPAAGEIGSSDGLDVNGNSLILFLEKLDLSWLLEAIQDATGLADTPFSEFLNNVRKPDLDRLSGQTIACKLSKTAARRVSFSQIARLWGKIQEEKEKAEKGPPGTSRRTKSSMELEEDDGPGLATPGPTLSEYSLELAQKLRDHGPALPKDGLDLTDGKGPSERFCFGCGTSRTCYKLAMAWPGGADGRREIAIVTTSFAHGPCHRCRAFGCPSCDEGSAIGRSLEALQPTDQASESSRTDTLISLCRQCLADFVMAINCGAKREIGRELQDRPASSRLTICAEHGLPYYSIRTTVELNATWLRALERKVIVLRPSDEGFQFAVSGLPLSNGPEASTLSREVGQLGLHPEARADRCGPGLSVLSYLRPPYTSDGPPQHGLSLEHLQRRISKDHCSGWKRTHPPGYCLLYCLAREELLRSPAWPLYDRAKIKIIAPDGEVFPRHTTVEDWLALKHVRQDSSELLGSLTMLCRAGSSRVLSKLIRLVQLESDHFALEAGLYMSKGPSRRIRRKLDDSPSDSDRYDDSPSDSDRYER